MRAIAVLCFVFLSAALAADAARNIMGDRTFLADYTRSTDSVDARVAQGVSSASLRLMKKAAFDFDLMAHTVRGLIVGRDAASITYSAGRNLHPKRGTVELTLKPLDWEGDDDRIHMFLQTVVSGRTPFGKLFIYKYKSSGLAAYLEFTQRGDKVFLRHAVNGWAAGSWHHVAVTYDLPGQLVLYVDGRRVDEATVDHAPSWPERFCVGPYGKGLGRQGGRTTIGLVAAYGRTLNDAEIRALAGDRLPDLKTGAAPIAAKRVVGKPTPWLQAGRPRLGLEALASDTVLPPWTPVKLDGDNVSILGRRYSFGEAGIMDSALSQGKELLAGPIALRVGAGSAARDLSFSTPRAIGGKSQGRVTLRREAGDAGAAQARLDCRVAYDGLIWCELTIRQHDDHAPDSVTLGIPLRAEAARFIHYVGAPHRYESQDLPRNSYSKSLADAPGTVLESGFRTTVWIGNNDRGLLWCAESDQCWWPKDRPDAIRVTRAEDGTAALTLRMITARPPKNDGAIVFRFGFMATPVKPMPAGWRAWTFSAQYDGRRGDCRGSHLIYWPDQWRFMSLDPEPHRAVNAQKTQRRVEADHKAGRRIIPYWTRLHAVTKGGDKVVPDSDRDMLREWRTTPNRPGGGSSQFFRCSTTSGWADYLVWCGEEWASLMGRLDGVYIDETQPIPNSRGASGGGYDALDGARRPTFEFFGSRRMYQRMMYNTLQRNGRPVVSVAHCSATHTMQCLSVFTVMFIGEQYYSGYFAKNPELLPPKDDRVYYYSYALPMDRLRAECFWGQWGAVMLWLPCLKNQKDIMTNPLTTRDMLSRVMQADMLVWPLFCNLDEVHKTWRFRREFGVGARDVHFVPYWENKVLTPDRDGVVVGYYRAADRWLALVSNLNRHPETVRIAFHNVPVRAVKNAETGDAVPFTRRGVTLSLRRNDYLALLIDE